MRVYASEVCQAAMASILAASAWSPRSAWTCWENTNLLPAAQPMRAWASSRRMRVELAVGAAVQHEPGHGVLHDVGHERVGGPPVALAPGGGAHLLFGDGVDALAEQEVVHAVDDRIVGLGAGYLAQAGHQDSSGECGGQRRRRLVADSKGGTGEAWAGAAMPGVAASNVIRLVLPPLVRNHHDLGAGHQMVTSGRSIAYNHSMSSVTGPLHQIRVLEIGSLIAGPFAGQLLGDYGAEIIKVEPPAGDPMRRWGVLHEGDGLWWTSIARNKQSVVLDLRTDEGAAAARRLAASADIVIENFRPGQLERWGLGYDDLVADNPG